MKNYVRVVIEDFGFAHAKLFPTQNASTIIVIPVMAQGIKKN
jgi:hypothetical protein